MCAASNHGFNKKACMVVIMEKSGDDDDFNKINALPLYYVFFKSVVGKRKIDTVQSISNKLYGSKNVYVYLILTDFVHHSIKFVYNNQFLG